ncbi:hypothetical protein, partial [Actinocorallia lasiicapitis]
MSSGAPGGLAAVTAFTDPERGRVECPAAALLAVQARVDLLDGPIEAGPGDGILFAVSWLSRSGQCAGLGLVADRADPA